MDSSHSIGPKTASILSSDADTMGRRHSVQFSEDTPMKTPSPRSQAHAARGNAKDDTAFRLNMMDFLNVMYDNKVHDGTGAESEKQPVAPTTTSGGGSGATATSSSTGPRARASMYRNAATAPQPQPPSPSAAGKTKCPQITGKTATSTAAMPMRTQGRQSGLSAGMARGVSGRAGDGIDMLVDHLVRAYSSRMGMGGDRGGGLMDDGGEAPISYNSGRRKGPITGRHATSDATDVSTFVSNALDTFFTAGSSHGVNQLTSTKSILSSLGLDENFAKLLSFKAQSGLSNGPDDDVDDESAQLKPVYIGEQAKFQSVTSHPVDVSVSKSMGAMHGGGLPPLSADDKAGTPSRENGGDGVPANVGGRRTTAMATAARENVHGATKDVSFTLDSKALLGTGEGDSDDSWGVVDAAAAAASEAEKMKANSASAKGTRSSSQPTKDSTAIQDLVKQETLSRNVVAALETQFRGYLATTLTDDKGATAVRGRRKPNDARSATAVPAGQPKATGRT